MIVRLSHVLGVELKTPGGKSMGHLVDLRLEGVDTRDADFEPKVILSRKAPRGRKKVRDHAAYKLTEDLAAQLREHARATANSRSTS